VHTGQRDRSGTHGACQCGDHHADVYAAVLWHLTAALGDERDLRLALFREYRIMNADASQHLAAHPFTCR
jgi:hypothetical protein